MRAEWLEETVWADVRRFLENPGEVLERVGEQMGDGAAELEERRADLVKRLAAKQAEKDRFVRLYAQGHISEEELDIYLSDLKNQVENLRRLAELLVAGITVGRKEDGSPNIEITYRFGPPEPGEGQAEEEAFVSGAQNALP